MKKLIAFSTMLLLVAASVATASPIFLFAPVPASMLNWSVLGSAIDVTGISSYADEHKRTIIATMVNGLDIAQDVEVIPNVKNKIALPKLKVGDGARPYSATHEPKAGQLVYSDRYLEVFPGKRDLLIEVEAFRQKHLAWRTNAGSGANKKFDDMDFAPFTWQEVIKGLQRELNDETAYFGFDKSTAAVYSEVATYAANAYIIYPVNGINEYFQNISGSTTTAGQDPIDTPAKWSNVTARAITPGIRSHIDAAISGGFSVTATGAVTDAATALAACKALFRSMPPVYKNWGVIINASYTDWEFLLDALATRTQYTNPDTAALLNAGMIVLPETGGKCLVKASTWLNGSRRLIAQPMNRVGNMAKGTNLVLGTDLLSDANDIKVVPDVYTEKIGMKFLLGFQIQDLDALRLGNQA